jgi:toxin-antitoxin system PIN domain toxin
MLCVDVNILVYAHRADAPDHAAYHAWLDAARVGIEPLGVSDLVLAGFVRVVTHPRIFREPTTLSTALDFAELLRASPAAVAVEPGDGHWAIFRELCRRGGAAGNFVPDAFLAALAIEHGATWVTADRGFARYPGLRWEHPLET